MSKFERLMRINKHFRAKCAKETNPVLALFYYKLACRAMDLQFADIKRGLAS